MHKDYLISITISLLHTYISVQSDFFDRDNIKGIHNTVKSYFIKSCIQTFICKRNRLIYFLLKYNLKIVTFLSYHVFSELNKRRTFLSLHILTNKSYK